MTRKKGLPSFNHNAVTLCNGAQSNALGHTGVRSSMNGTFSCWTSTIKNAGLLRASEFIAPNGAACSSGTCRTNDDNEHATPLRAMNG